MALCGLPVGSVIVVAIAGAVPALMLGIRLRALRSAVTRAEIRRNQASASEAATTRLLHVSASDIRDLALSLLGHADIMRSRAYLDPSLHAAAVSAMGAQLIGLADDLQDHAVPTAASRVLHDEELGLDEMLRDAVASVAATLEPSRRHWRITPVLRSLAVIADRRALHQVLVRVMANAVRFSRHDDWVDLSVENLEEGLALAVADEGAGLPSPEGDPPPGLPASRGLGLGLSLARVLMEAHGGSLTVESRPRIGTRVVLVFPMSRVVRKVSLAV